MAKAQEPLQVVCDTREQRPWAFPVEQVTVHRQALKAGDYSLLGLEDIVALERKSLGDYVGTVIGNWIRFRKELNRLSCYDVAAIVVEANISQIWNHEYESEATPDSVIGRMNAIFLDHSIPTFFWGDHQTAAKTAHRFLLLTYRRLTNEGKITF